MVKSFMKLFILCLIFWAQSLSAATVVDYYNEIPESVSGFNNYSFKLVNQKWVATKYEASIPDVVADIRNGYIHVGDEGTGGGRLTTEIALFKSRSGTPYIAIATNNFFGIPMRDYEFKIFRKSGRMWKDVTSSAMPQIQLKQYLTGQPLEHSAIKTMKLKNVLQFALPRQGTDLKVHLDIAWFDYYLSLEDTPAQVKNAYRHFKKIAVYKTLVFQWDSRKAKFVFLRKIPA